MDNKIKEQRDKLITNRDVYQNIMNQLIENNLESDLINLFFTKVITCDKQIKDYEDWLGNVGE